MNKKEMFILSLIVSVVLNIFFLYDVHKMIQRSDIARTYINELEEQVGDNLMDTVGSGDAYLNYYSYE